jgi:uncharacterized protein YndB with AHSA1/START domain
MGAEVQEARYMKQLTVLCCTIAVSVISAPVSADVKLVSDKGFVSSNSVTVRATPEVVYRTLGQPATWWSSKHTWSGDARNLSLKLRAGGCFCERLPKEKSPKDKGSVEHGRVIFARPARMLRLRAALGPLQAEAVAATLTWSLKAVEGGTEITQDYVVSGMIRGGMSTFAPAVDAVLSDQLERLARHIDDNN